MLKRLREWRQRKKANKAWNRVIESLELPKDAEVGRMHIHRVGNNQYFFTYRHNGWKFTGQSTLVHSKGKPFEVNYIKFDR